MAESQNAEVFRNSPECTDFGLRDVKPATFQQSSPAPAREFGLTPRDVNLQTRAKFAIPIQSLGHDGFLEPIGVELFKRVPDKKASDVV